jgi:hypothetical protein
MDEEMNIIQEPEEKKRAVFFTVWLILSGILTFIVSIINLTCSEWIARNAPGTPDWGPLGIKIIGLTGFLVVGTIVAIWYWKKWGIFVNAILALGIFVLNIYLGLGIGQSLFGLAGPAIIIFMASKQWSYFN